MNYAEMLLEGRKRRKSLYLTPEDFLVACAEYFQWAEDNPLIEEQVNIWQGVTIRSDINKARAFTKRALATHLGIPESRLDTYKARKDEAWVEAVEMVEQVIYTQKFEHAAAGLMNAGLITRDLGLAEKQELTGRDGEPLQQVVQYQLPSNGRDGHEPPKAEPADGSADS